MLFNLPISIFLPDSSIVADMDILIGYRSALEYWRLVGPGFLRGISRTKDRNAPRDESVVVPLEAAACARKPPTGRMQAARSRNRRHNRSQNDYSEPGQP
ncbi:MAG: hypothetical protein ACLTMP_04830 [Eggerthella lenta]